MDSKTDFFILKMVHRFFLNLQLSPTGASSVNMRGEILNTCLWSALILLLFYLLLTFFHKHFKEMLPKDRCITQMLLF